MPLTFPEKELSCVGLCFGTPEAPSLTTVPIKSATFSVTSIRKDLGVGEPCDIRLPACSAYFLMLYLDDVDHADIRPDGTCTPVRCYERGSICLVDLDEGAAIRLHSRLNALAFVLPKSLFEEAATLSKGTEKRRLACRRGRPDSVLSNLGTALLVLLGGGRQPSPPALLRHMAVAICAHLLHQYGETPDDATTATPQSSRAGAAVPENGHAVQHGEPPLSLLATAAGLAEDEFLKEFKDATGLTPAQWLIWIRAERARETDDGFTRTFRQHAYTDRLH